ncbi:molybdopterin synthase sulfur carrier subunit [Klebsiella pneumoniae]
MIKVLFFAQVRELVGTDSLTLDASELATVEAVRQQLAARGDRWALALEEGKLLAAVNQTLTSSNIQWPAATKWRSSHR